MKNATKNAVNRLSKSTEGVRETKSKERSSEGEKGKIVCRYVGRGVLSGKKGSAEKRGGNQGVKRTWSTKEWPGETQKGKIYRRGGGISKKRRGEEIARKKQLGSRLVLNREENDTTARKG